MKDNVGITDIKRLSLNNRKVAFDIYFEKKLGQFLFVYV
jgi:hypothetical protein